MIRCLSFLLFFGLFGCALSPEKQLDYAAIAKHPPQTIKRWSLDGRISVSSPIDSWSANMLWQRDGDVNTIELSGPLGQGKVLIKLQADAVSIDRGDGQLMYSEYPDEFVKEQLGVFVPVSALANWVIGMPSSDGAPVKQTSNGFEQAGWLVEYKGWQQQANYTLPKKLIASNSGVKLKLICDKWEIQQ